MKSLKSLYHIVIVVIPNCRNRFFVDQFAPYFELSGPDTELDGSSGTSTDSFCISSLTFSSLLVLVRSSADSFSSDSFSGSAGVPGEV